MPNKTNVISYNYCKGCKKFCRIDVSYDPKTTIYRPKINNTIIYDYTPINTNIPQIQIYWDKTQALTKAHEIIHDCKYRKR